MEYRQASATVLGDSSQNAATVREIVASCSANSLTAERMTPRTARKYPLIQALNAINGSPGTSIRKACAELPPRNFSERKSAPSHKTTQAVKLISKLNPKHLATAEGMVSGCFLPMALVTRRVTVRLTPAVEMATAGRNTDKIN